jgi:hypothetical protein
MHVGCNKPLCFRLPAAEEELLVYGPINREPEEKLFPWKYQRKDSGVRKLYVLIFYPSLSVRCLAVTGSVFWRTHRYFRQVYFSFVRRAITVVDGRQSRRIPLNQPNQIFPTTLQLFSVTFEKRTSFFIFTRYLDKGVVRNRQ